MNIWDKFLIGFNIAWIVVFFTLLAFGCAKAKPEAPKCQPTEAQIETHMLWVALSGPGSWCQWNTDTCSFDCEEGEGWK